MVRCWNDTNDDLEPVLDQITQTWEARGWDVTAEAPAHDEIWARALTPEGHWFAAREEPHNNRLRLTGHSPVYWGEYDILLAAIVDRRAAQTAAGETWSTTDRDHETRRASRQPGEYRPFPAWDILDGYTPEPTPIPKPWEEDN